MNCDTYLSMLETLPVDELAYGDAAHHAATCRDCDRVTRVVAERERNMLLAYGTITPPVPTGPLAAHAVELSRRRRIAFFFRTGLAAAAVVSVVGFVMTRRAATASIAPVTETFRLQCMSVDDAAALLRESLGPNIRLSARGGILRIGGRSVAELRQARSFLDMYESRCALGATGGVFPGSAAGAVKATRRVAPF